MNLRQTLNHAVTAFDRRNEARAAKSRRGYHNPNALGLYLIRVGEACDAIEAGADASATIARMFSDKLETVLQRAIKGESSSLSF
jgi:hypothetical protein